MSGTAQEFALTDLARILREGAGSDESVELNDTILDTEFDDLGYDSLAMLETSSRIEREFGVDLGDDTLAEARTPRALIGAVNDRLTSAAA